VRFQYTNPKYYRSSNLKNHSSREQSESSDFEINQTNASLKPEVSISSTLPISSSHISNSSFYSGVSEKLLDVKMSTSVTLTSQASVPSPLQVNTSNKT